MMKRTMGEIAKRYNAKREDHLRRARAGHLMADMVSDYPKPFEMLDIDSDDDRRWISMELQYQDGENVLTGLKPISKGERALWRELHGTYRLPCGADRETAITQIRTELFELKIRELMNDGRYHGVNHREVMRRLAGRP